VKQSTKAIVKQVLIEAAGAPHFFNLSDAQRLNWMIERAFELGKAIPKYKHSRGAVPSRSHCASLELVVHLRPKRVHSNRRK
jgi:hypothetical protein